MKIKKRGISVTYRLRRIIFLGSSRISWHSQLRMDNSYLWCRAVFQLRASDCLTALLAADLGDAITSRLLFFCAARAVRITTFRSSLHLAIELDTVHDRNHRRAPDRPEHHPAPCNGTGGELRASDVRTGNLLFRVGPGLPWPMARQPVVGKLGENDVSVAQGAGGGSDNARLAIIAQVQKALDGDLDRVSSNREADRLCELHR